MGQELQVLLGTGLQANTSSHITNESEKLKITEFVNKTKANKLNHLTLLFLINYLQKFCVPHIVAETKMNDFFENCIQKKDIFGQCTEDLLNIVFRLFYLYLRKYTYHSIHQNELIISFSI